MIDFSAILKAALPVIKVLARGVAVIVFGALPVVAASANDSYLDMLDQEASKVEARPSDTQKDGPGGSSRSGEVGTMSRQAFEAELRDRHVGTYSFYGKLPERSREEIYLDYQRGASLEALREKIIERYLHP